MRSQIAAAFGNLDTVLTAAGFTLGDVVRLNIFTTDVAELFANYGELFGRLAAANVQPASTLLGVNALAIPGMMIEIEATAAR